MTGKLQTTKTLWLMVTYMWVTDCFISDIMLCTAHMESFCQHELYRAMEFSWMAQLRACWEMRAQVRTKLDVKICWMQRWRIMLKLILCIGMLVFALHRQKRARGARTLETVWQWFCFNDCVASVSAPWKQRQCQLCSCVSLSVRVCLTQLQKSNPSLIFSVGSQTPCLY